MCTKCNQEKSETDFTKDRQKPDGLNAKCRDCNSQMQAGVYARRADLARAQRFKITVEQAAYLMAKPCGFCGKPANEGGGRGAHHIDHDHRCCAESAKSCGRCVRGPLCVTCNMHLVGGYEALPRELQTWHQLNNYIDSRFAWPEELVNV